MTFVNNTVGDGKKKKNHLYKVEDDENDGERRSAVALGKFRDKRITDSREENKLNIFFTLQRGKIRVHS